MKRRAGDESLKREINFKHEQKHGDDVTRRRDKVANWTGSPTLLPLDFWREQKSPDSTVDTKVEVILNLEHNHVTNVVTRSDRQEMRQQAWAAEYKQAN